MGSYFAPNYTGAFCHVFDDTEQSGNESPNTKSGQAHTLLSPAPTPQPYVPLLTQSAGPLSPTTVDPSQLSPHILGTPPTVGSPFLACPLHCSKDFLKQEPSPFSPTATTPFSTFASLKETPCTELTHMSFQPQRMLGCLSPVRALFSPCVQSINMLELSGFIKTKASLGLACAVCNANIQEMQLLLSDGANPSFRVGSNQMTLLMVAAINEIVSPSSLMTSQDALCAEMCSLLLNFGASCNSICLMGKTALHWAVSCSKQPNAMAIQLLLQKKADPNVSDCKGATPLMCAAQSGNIEASKLLLMHGASVKMKDHDGLTALHYAAKYNHPEIVELLVAHGASCQEKHSCGSTPLHLAAGFGAVQCVKNLLMCSSVPIVNIQGGGKQTPLHFAVHNHHLECAKVLLEGGADPNAQSTWGTPLQMAITNNDPEMEQLIQSFCSSATDGPVSPQDYDSKVAVLSHHCCEKSRTSAHLALNATQGTELELTEVISPSVTVSLPMVMQFFPELINKQVLYNGAPSGAVLVSDGIRASDGSVFLTPTSFTRKISGSRSSGWKQLSVEFKGGKCISLWQYKNCQQHRLELVAGLAKTMALSPCDCFGVHNLLHANPIFPFLFARTSTHEPLHQQAHVLCELKSSYVSVDYSRPVGTTGTVFEGMTRNGPVLVKRFSLSETGGIDVSPLLASFDNTPVHGLLHIIGTFRNGIDTTAVYVVCQHVVSTLHSVISHASRCGTQPLFPLEWVINNACSVAHSLQTLFQLQCSGASSPLMPPSPVVLTSDSILMTSAGEPLLCPLPCCEWLLGGPTTTLNGQTRFRSPEHITDCSLCDEPAAVFSFGLIILEMLTGELPLSTVTLDDRELVLHASSMYSRTSVSQDPPPSPDAQASPVKQQQQKQNCDSTPFSIITASGSLLTHLQPKNSITNQLCDLVQACLTKDPTSRPSFEILAAHLDSLASQVSQPVSLHAAE